MCSSAPTCSAFLYHRASTVQYSSRAPWTSDKHLQLKLELLPAPWSPGACCSVHGCRGGAAELCHPPVTLPFGPVPNCASDSAVKKKKKHSTAQFVSIYRNLEQSELQQSRSVVNANISLHIIWSWFFAALLLCNRKDFIFICIQLCQLEIQVQFKLVKNRLRTLL